MTRRPEAALERQVLHILGSDPDLAIFRNECGEGYYGNVRAQIAKLTRVSGHDGERAAMVRLADVLAILDRGRVHYGLHNGSADLIGVLHGSLDVAGRFVSFELKSDTGRLRPEQEVWRDRMRQLGALAEVVRSPGDAVRFIEEARRGQR